MKMKIVIISRSTYPHQSPRANRTHELAKQLAKEHDVTLYVLTGAYDYSDYISTTGVKVKSLGTPKGFSFDPSIDVKQKFIHKVLFKLFHRYFDYPYIELACLTNKVLRKESDVDLLITIAVPHPIHWGAAFFKKYNKEKLQKTVWVADCGDPFMGNPFNKHAFYFKYIEQMFCEQADFIAVPTEKAINAYYPQFREKIKVIPQGFDLEGIQIERKAISNAVKTFIFAGTFYKDLRDPTNFLEYLVDLSNKGYDFRFIVYTKSKDFLMPFKEALKDKLIISDYMPRAALLNKLAGADFLLNIENLSAVQSPSKLIDYVISGRPVFSFKSGSNDFKMTFLRFLEGDYEESLMLPSIDDFNIKSVARKFVELST